MNDRGKLLTLFRGQPDLVPTSTKEFGGFDYCARFSSSVPIILESVAFYGRKLTGDEYAKKYIPIAPGEDKGDKNKSQASAPKIWAALVLEIRQSYLFYPRLREANRQVLMAKMAIEVDVTKSTEGQVFFVKLPDAVSIPANLIFDVAFQLYGIDQLLKFHCLGATENLSKLIPVGQVDIEVHHSSSQCAGFQFRVSHEIVDHPPQLAHCLEMCAIKQQLSMAGMRLSSVPKKKLKGKAKAVKYLANAIGVFDNFPMK